MIASSASQEVISRFLVAVNCQPLASAPNRGTEPTKPLLMVRSVQDVSDISRPKQQNVSIDTLGHVSRQAHSRGVADRIEWEGRVEDRWCQHLRRLVVWNGLAVEVRFATSPRSQSSTRKQCRCGGWCDKL